MVLETKKKSGNEEIMDLLDVIKQRVMDTGIEVNMNEEKFKKTTQNQLELDTAIDILEYNSTGYAVIKTIKKENESLMILVKNVDYSDDQIKALSAEYIFSEDVGYGFGTISYKETNTYFCGLMKEREPFLMGFFVENGITSFKIDVGLEYGISKFISTTKNAAELIDFIEDLQYKKVLPDFLVNNIIRPAYKNQALPKDSTTSLFQNVKVKSIKNQALEQGYEIVFKNGDLNNAATLNFKVLKNGENEKFSDGGLNKMLDIINVVDEFYKKEGIRLWHLDSLKNKLDAHINDYALDRLKKLYNIPQSSPIFLSKLESLEFNTKFYYVENNQVKEILPSPSIRYMISSNTGRTGYYVDSNDISDKMEKYAFKWKAGFTLDILVSEPSMNEVHLIEISGSKVYGTLDLIKETLFKKD